MKEDKAGVREFLQEFPGMSRVPSSGPEVVLRGVFEFSACPPKDLKIRDKYHLRITVPPSFPQAIPRVIELDRKIPRTGEYHVNYVTDNTLCLGSPLRLLEKIDNNPTLVGFANECLIPYLYAVTYKLQFGGDLVFNELAHGKQGIIDDYLVLFGLSELKQVLQTVQLLGMKKKVADKQPCPCGSGLKLEQCNYRLKIDKFRRLADKSWFRKCLTDLL